MNKNLNFDDIYNDFFGENALVKNKEVAGVETKVEDQTPEVSKEDLLAKVDSLYINDTSKELLTKILNYILNYNENITYVNFNIELTTNNNEIKEKVISLLESAIKLNNYTDKKTIENISMYKIDTVQTLEDAYTNNGIIVLKDLEGTIVQDTNFKKKLLHTIKEHLQDRKITILIGTKEETSSFFNNDLDEKSLYFNFTLEGINPSSNEILNNILESLKENTLSSKDQVNLLSYINETFTKSGLDYKTYKDNLVKYISFNNKIPELEEVKSTEEIFKDLNDLVGLAKVKKSLYDLVDLITLKNKTKDDLKLKNINLHMLFLGNPGTGKTTVARMLSNILYNLGYIRQNKLIEVSSKDLVAEYVGQTAPKTMEVINNSLGGILFIDEAYALATDKTNSYNKEAIATLIKAMEDYRDDLVVIFAGYTKEMQDFIDSNSGIASRIGYTFMFDDYTNYELKEIFTGMMKKSGFIVKDEALTKLEELIDNAREDKNFGNARFVRNVYEKTIIMHATNTKNIKDKTKLKTITKADITV